MKYLLDTNIISQQDSSAKIRNWVMQHYLTLSVSTMTIAELSAGIEDLAPGPKRLKYQRQLEGILQEYHLLDFGVREAREWGRYLKKVGRPLPVMDSLIAAVALANNLEVVTDNTADFPGVRTVNPTV